MDEQRRVRRERLRWHCRRALLELDIVFQRFWARDEELNEIDEAALEKLLAIEDHDLWSLVSGREEIDDPQLKSVVERLRRS
ncbi:MAG: succinate dehydrogenase assembly factor 2 [Gammaproteobacteria bacterium]|nr:succinate dehydrogenase assembly factor 2 [Gammaproteobacteria bacterium]MBU1414858.1 succinate dehydrogenase assembly factor 2 [Gammaproteobacteria bacterium]